MSIVKPTPFDVLCYGVRKRSSTTVRRHYEHWRAQNGQPLQCDNPVCVFNTAPLEWNGERLPLTLDHVSGDHCDNSPDNLRLLCPNCDSQLPTRGGRNRGRVQAKSASGYAIQHPDGRRDARVFLTGVSASAEVGILRAVVGNDEKDS
jgi:hypothetical protein